MEPEGRALQAKSPRSQLGGWLGDLASSAMGVQREQGCQECSGGDLAQRDSVTAGRGGEVAGSTGVFPKEKRGQRRPSASRGSSCEESSWETGAWRPLPREKKQSRGLAQSQGRRKHPGVSRPGRGHQEAEEQRSEGCPESSEPSQM